MRLKKLPPECIAPFRLKEITLHGIGSYYKPTRLEIKPLTILCGTNGSGKSTWMKVLSTLKEALDPLRDDDGKIIESNYLGRLTSAMIKKDLLNVNLLWHNRFTDIHDPAWKTHEGPQGSFSVTYVCTKPVKLVDVYQAHPDAHEIPVLQINELKRGDVISLRFTQSRLLREGKYQGPLGCQITINNDVASVYFGQIEVKGEYRQMLQLGSRGTDPQENGETVFQDCGPLSNATVNALSLMCEQLISQCLTGYFKISAIRNIYDEIEEGEHLLSSRYVGENGKYTHYFQRYFSTVPMLDPRKEYSYCGTVTNDNDEASGWKSVYVPIDHERNNPVHEILWRLPGLSQWESLLQFPCFCEYLSANHRNKLLDLKEEFQRKVSDSGAEATTILRNLATLIETGKGRILNNPFSYKQNNLSMREFFHAAHDIFEVLRSEIVCKPTFFRWFVCEFQNGSFKDGLPVALEKIPSWVMYLSGLPDSELHPDDRETLNEWALAYFEFGCLEPIIGLKCAMVFNWWSYHLLGVDVKALRCAGYSTRHFVGERKDPVGYFVNYSKPEADEFEFPACPYSSRFLGDLNGELEAPTYKPGTFSAGLHQVSPILVQMNMMKMNELLAVENPEVHLHPGLQLKLMGFFIENALIGKYSLIETHSDLMIRRVMRAIHEEKLPQSWVNVFFVDEEQVEGKDIWTSKIDRLWLDNQGAISNWPKGFLDDDVLESEALMRAMYGTRRIVQTEDTDHE